MDDLSNLVHNIVVASIQNPIQIDNLLTEVANPSNKIGAMLVKLLLDLFAPENLLVVRLSVNNFTVIVVNLGLSLTSHSRAEIIFLLISLSKFPDF